MGKKENDLSFLVQLQDLIDVRKKKMPENSYTTKLFKKGINKISKKFGEEAVELIIEAKDNDENLFLNEAADVMYHYIVMLSAKGYRLEDVVKTLKGRSKI